jgi:hypothetical protein
MALTDTEKFKVVYYLGYPAKTLIENSTNYDKIVVDRLNLLGTPVEALVRGLLCKLEKADEQLTKALCRMSTKKIDDIEFRDGEAEALRKEKRSVAKELGALLDITPIMGGGPGSTIGICV